MSPCTRRAATARISGSRRSRVVYIHDLPMVLYSTQRRNVMDREETGCGWDSVPYGASPVSGMDQMSQMVSVMQRYSNTHLSTIREEVGTFRVYPCRCTIFFYRCYVLAVIMYFFMYWHLQMANMQLARGYYNVFPTPFEEVGCPQRCTWRINNRYTHRYVSFSTLTRMYCINEHFYVLQHIFYSSWSMPYCPPGPAADMTYVSNVSLAFNKFVTVWCTSMGEVIHLERYEKHAIRDQK